MHIATQIPHLENILGLGLAGNFANHLEQAGEAGDFACIVGDEECAPKGIFPFYVPRDGGFLGRFCVNNEAVILPSDKSLKVQAEAEVGLFCEIIYENNPTQNSAQNTTQKIVKNIHPTHFVAFNDASVRNDKSATKLSQKKNFSLGSKGYGANRIAIPSGTFTQGGICDDYSLVAFIESQGILEQYGELSALNSYSYFYEKLTRWIVKKLNTQGDLGVLESMPTILHSADYPTSAIVAIGATRYTAQGEKRFLENGDTVSVAVFNHRKYSLNAVKLLIKSGDSARFRELSDISILMQKVVQG